MERQPTSFLYVREFGVLSWHCVYCQSSRLQLQVAYPRKGSAPAGALLGGCPLSGTSSLVMSVQLLRSAVIASCANSRVIDRTASTFDRIKRSVLNGAKHHAGDLLGFHTFGLFRCFFPRLLRFGFWSVRAVSNNSLKYVVVELVSMTLGA